MSNGNTDSIKPYGFIKNMHLIEAAYFDERLQEQTKLTLALLIRYAASDGTISWFSVKSTAAKKGVSRRAIQNQIDKLIQHEYLCRENRQGSGWRNKYCLLFHHLDRIEGVTQLGHTPHVTPLGHTPVTASGIMGVTPSGHIKKTRENIEIKKEKRARSLDGFLFLVEEGVNNRLFDDLGTLGLDELKKQAVACWEHWDGSGSFPTGSMTSAFKGWLRKGMREGSIKETKSRESNPTPSRESEDLSSLPDWQVQMYQKLGPAEFNSWIKPLQWDGERTIYAPNAYSANWIQNKYMDHLQEVIPDAIVEEMRVPIH